METALCRIDQPRVTALEFKEKAALDIGLNPMKAVKAVTLQPTLISMAQFLLVKLLEEIEVQKRFDE